jgi:KDO2-lipid IV(A) lauroyltransferase
LTTAATRRLRRLLLPPLLGGLRLLFGSLPRRHAQRLGAALGGLVWRLARRDRRRALEHLAIAFPGLDPRARPALARSCFRHLGTSLAESLLLLGADCAAVGGWVAAEGWERVEELHATGRPILILTGHCGNWELLAAWINCHRLGMAVVARSLDEPGVNELVVGLRARFGTETIERGEPGAARRLLRVLRGGGALGMLIDQDTRVEGVWVPFFGRPAYTPVGAARIALKQDAAVVPSFIERLPDGRHLARFLPPLDLPDDETEATALMTAAIEAQIRRVPEQWVWMHRGWRRQPPVAGR